MGDAVAETTGELTWSRYVALGDSLTAGQGDPGPDGRPIGWAQRLARILTARTAVSCRLVNLATGGATVPVVLGQQLPAVPGLQPDLVSVTVGMNDIRVPEFSPKTFTAGLGRLLEGLTATGATVLASTLPDIAEIAPLPRALIEIAHQRIRQASDIIREQAARLGVICLDAWAMPGSNDPGLFSDDRFHPNASGHSLMATAFADLLVPG
ncbi:MAG: SGNH/GDSL hydrolase family protein [Streptosporangiaceae bacterium]